MVASYYCFKSLAILALVLAFCILSISGSSIVCENLKKDSCAFAISSGGKRCVLEEGYTCRTSDIEAYNSNIYKLKDWIETDECIQACGLERNVLGISSDSLLDLQFRQKLCSTECYYKCPNIVDLYFNLAAGEGVYLPKLCKSQGENARRGMLEIKSSGIVAVEPITAGKFIVAAEPTAAENFIAAQAPTL